MSRIDHMATAVTERSWIVIGLMVLATVALGGGAAAIDQTSGIGGIAGDSEIGDARNAVQEQFTTREANTTTMVVAVRSEDGNVLSKESLLRSLRYQRSVRTNATLRSTLVDERPTFGVANVVARRAIAADRSEGVSSNRETNATGGGSAASEPPTIEEGIARLEAMDAAAVERVVERVVDPDRSGAASRAVYRQLPRSYDPGSTTADARLIVVTQETDGTVLASAALSEEVSDGQQAARSIAKAQSGSETYTVVARGLVSPQQEAAISDSLGILGPLALLFVLVSLSVAYRDPVDVVLGLVGVVVVLVWTFGAMGWLGIDFGQTMIAAPILLIGLSVDYAFHVVMRYREERGAEAERGVRSAMQHSLVGVGPALVLVTVTTAIGFLATTTSPLATVGDFGVVTAIGIVATLLVFTLFVPALKTVIASALERRGRDRTPSSPGTAGRLRRVLGAGSTVARRAPLAVLAIALVLSAGGAYGATHVEVSASQELFMADEPPAWTDELPEAVEPGEFFLKENRRYVFSEFQSPDQQGYVLVEGRVTAPETLERVARAEGILSGSGAAMTDATGEPAVVGPLSAMTATAEENEPFDATLAAADTDDDGVPDRNLDEVYDAFHATAPDLAARTVHRTDDGEYDALRLRMAVHADADQDAAVASLQTAAEAVDGGEQLTAIATGTPVIDVETTDRVSTTMVESLAVTLLVVLALLSLFFRRREGSATLGALTLVPVGFAVTWLLGTMALLAIPISPVTALVGSIAVGLGVDYAIHVTERFADERRAGADTRTALVRTVTGTGSAMLGSAVTTAAGFGVLSFALLPGLRQFGFVLALGIVYAFVATVYVQPSLLALWDRTSAGTKHPAAEGATTGDD